MRSEVLVAVVSYMVAVVASAEPSNDVVLLKLQMPPGTKAFFGEKEVTDAGLAVAPGTAAVLTITNTGARATRRDGFTVVRTAAELKMYELPPLAAGQDMIRASSGVVLPMLAGTSVQIDRAVAIARAELARQIAGNTNASDKTTVSTNAVVRERVVRTTANTTVVGSSIERIVWCAENGAVNVFVCEPRSRDGQKASKR